MRDDMIFNKLYDNFIPIDGIQYGKYNNIAYIFMKVNFY